MMKIKTPDYLKKIAVITGDCTLPDLGIGEQYREIFKNEVIALTTLITLYYKKMADSFQLIKYNIIINLFKVNVIIHAAATVRFNENLRNAVHTNVISVQYLLELCKEMKHLKVNRIFLYPVPYRPISYTL